MRAHPAAIICHTDQHFAARCIINRNTPRTGIDGIFDQLFHRRGRTFNNFTRGNTIDRRLVQGANLRAR